MFVSIKQISKIRHSRAGGNPFVFDFINRLKWIPACAGMTM